MDIQQGWPPPQKEEEPAKAGPEEKRCDDSNHTLDPLPEQRAPRPLKARTKAAAVLRIMLERGDRGLNCFEAVRDAHDYVLRTTVSNLQIQYGITFDRHHEQVPGHGDSVIDCVRYVLTPQGRSRANEILRRAT